MNKRTVLYVIAANVLALIALTFIYPEFMVSPGSTGAAHATLGNDCFACHQPFLGASEARCQSCHAGAMLTDGKPHATQLYDVGSLDTPSLKGVFATAPYLHDGSARSLRQVFTTPGTSMREHDQRGLSAADLEALEAFVSTR